MKNILKSLLKQVLFWFAFFALARMIFIAYYFSTFKSAGLTVFAALFYNNIRLDFSAICYILALPVVILMIQLLYSTKWLNKVSLIYTIAMIIVCSLIVTAEIGVFAEWQTKLTYKALSYLMHPSEVYNSAGGGNFLVLFLVLALLISVSIGAFKRFIYMEIPNEKPKIIRAFLCIAILPVILILGLRGGMQEIPINQSQSYFSQNNSLNLLSVNPFWNFIHSVFQNYGSWKQNPFLFYNTHEADKIVKQLNQVPDDSTVCILKKPDPNIVMVILEGWSADLIEALGGKPGITPRFDTLVKNGLLFTKIYSPGSRSEQGMSSIFSSFPAQPITAIAHMPDKFVKLPSFPSKLKDAGYHTSYYFGGQLIYGNLKSYIYFNHFDRITEGLDFPDEIPRGKLGVHDQFMYPRVLADLKSETQPFFTSIFTTSTHSPYDWPNKKEILHFGDPERDYVNAAHYADSCLASFILECSKQKWFENTLFIFVADHGHSTYNPRNVYDPGYQHIPLLFYGNALKPEFKGVKDSVIGSQVDIAATLLKQMGIKSAAFHWSKDLLNPKNPQFAFISYEVGFTWVCRDGYFVYDHNQKKIIENTIPENKKDSIIKAGKAYLQQVYQEYWDF
jgi:phosphoglycerol transferase MdoB-like AlkP superfamily enzyme